MLKKLCKLKERFDELYAKIDIYTDLQSPHSIKAYQYEGEIRRALDKLKEEIEELEKNNGNK